MRVINFYEAAREAIPFRPQGAQSRDDRATLWGLAQLRPGEVYAGEYAIEGVLGVGAFGTVYKCRSPRFPP